MLIVCRTLGHIGASVQMLTRSTTTIAASAVFSASLTGMLGTRYGVVFG
jgi:hypothetical protein